MALEDYGALLSSGFKAYSDPIAFNVGLNSDRLQQQAAKQTIAANDEKLKRSAQFRQDLTGVGTNPTAGNVSSLMMKYPEFAEQLKSGWDVKDKAAKDSEVTQLGELYSAAAAGNWDLASKSAHARLDADKAAGKADPADQAFVDAIDSGDEQKRKAALTTIGLHLAAATGPEHFATTYGALNKNEGGFTLGAGDVRYDAKGNPIAQSPYIKGADGTLYERDSGTMSEGKGPGERDDPMRAFGNGAPTGQIIAPGGFDHAVETVLSNEGGYSPKDMNGAPVNFGINAKANGAELKKLGVANIKDLTRDQAVQIYRDKYWAQSGAENLPPNMQTPYFDVYVRNPAFAKKALAQSGGDPAKFMAASSSYFQQLGQKPSGRPYAQAWANRDANNAAIATGGAPSDAQPAAPAGLKVLVPGKRDAPSGFAWAADGKSLVPIPGGPADEEDLDPSTVNFYAQQYLTTGTMPALGMGKSATKIRRQIMKQAATVAGADGLTGKDLALQMAHYKAGVANITNLEKQLGTVSGNELTFAQNAQQVADLARKLPAQTGSRILNSGIQTYLRQTNDPTVAALDVAIKTAANEYARLVTASPSGAGVLSDSARLEYQGIIEGDFPLKQKLSALHQMSVDANNRTRSLHTTLQDAYAHLGDRAPELTGASSKGSGGKTVVRTGRDKSGKKVVQYSDGSIAYAN